MAAPRIAALESMQRPASLADRSEGAMPAEVELIQAQRAVFAAVFGISMNPASNIAVLETSPSARDKERERRCSVWEG